MSSTNQLAKSIAHHFREVRSATCQHRAQGVMNRTSRTVLDDSGSLAVTVWICSKCSGVIEEIYILKQDGRTRPKPMHFAHRTLGF